MTSAQTRGDFMEPFVSHGDRLLVDVIRRAPGHRRDGGAVGRLRTPEQ